jgi:predicted nucleotidyltransferase
MRPSTALERHRDRIREIALSHRVTNVRVFGSALRGEDTEDSDLDILVEPTAETSYFDLGAIQYELSELLGLRVDVLTLESLPERFRQSVLDAARPV